MDTEIDQLVTISPEIWPGQKLELQPGDLSRWAPGGLGLGSPMVMRPWDKLEDQPGQFYGWEKHSAHPFMGAPKTSSGGGTIYFNQRVSAPALEVTTRLMEVYGGAKDYAVFLRQSARPWQENYLVQMRIVRKMGLTHLYGIEADELPDQPLTVCELLYKFVEDQIECWDPGFSRKLDGMLGGDGDWAKESLAFGFLVENEYQGIYRIWSRAWLVTK